MKNQAITKLFMYHIVVSYTGESNQTREFNPTFDFKTKPVNSRMVGVSFLEIWKLEANHPPAFLEIGGN